jgi:hypothetical protein
LRRYSRLLVEVATGLKAETVQLTIYGDSLLGVLGLYMQLREDLEMIKLLRLIMAVLMHLYKSFQDSDLAGVEVVVLGDLQTPREIHGGFCKGLDNSA